MNKVLILVSRPNSLTNKDGVVSIICNYDEYKDRLSVVREDMLVGKAWDYRSTLLPENYADTRIDLYWQHDTPEENVTTLVYRGKHYELFNTEFYR